MSKRPEKYIVSYFYTTKAGCQGFAHADVFGYNIETAAQLVQHILRADENLKTAIILSIYKF